MPRRCLNNNNNNSVSEDEPPRKKWRSESEQFVKDLTGKHWRIGKTIGVGGFGEIYLASDHLNREVDTNNSPYVVKVENHEDGPLFVEINCYLRIGKLEMIEAWKRKKNIPSLGMPHYVTSGSHTSRKQKYRFLVIPRFETDLEKILEEKKVFNIKTVITIATQIIDVLEYIHSKGYIHSDIKASNMLVGIFNQAKSCKKDLATPTTSRTRRYEFRSNKIPRSKRLLRPIKDRVNYREVDENSDQCDSDVDSKDTSCKSTSTLKKPTDQVYLLDYGLASKYRVSKGTQKPFDERKAHAGTILFCSRDAHKGGTSRRSDLESLGYNMMYWLTGDLPWSKDSDNPLLVEKKKQRAMADPKRFLSTYFPGYPKFLFDYLIYLRKLQYQDQPDYTFCKNLFKTALLDYGYKDDSRFDFDNLQGWGNKQKKLKKSENFKKPKLVCRLSRLPLQSNIPIKPFLRKKLKNKVLKHDIHWSKILVDPEGILKQARKLTEQTTESVPVHNISDLDLQALNPTYAMIEVFNKRKERMGQSPTYKGDSEPDNINGYTPAMMSVVNMRNERKEREWEKMPVQIPRTRNGRSLKTKSTTRNTKTVSRSTQIETTKSVIVIKKDCLRGRKEKMIPLKRTYSLRG